MSSMLSDLIPDAARQHGALCAFRDPGEAITFAEMERKTAQLATYLRAQGVEEGDRVAICMPSSVLTAICVHGVFRAGAAFVPVDPDVPVARIRTILSDCGVRHVLAVSALAPKLAEACEPLDIALLVASEHGPSGWASVWDTAPVWQEPSRDPERLAYIMYTSGSTGTPKGISHTHRSGLAYAQTSASTYNVAPGDVLATTGPLHFDVSTFVYLTAPAAAATAVVVPQPFTRMPASMAQFLESAGVTMFYTTASGLGQFVDRGALDKRDLSALRWVLFCGEPMPITQLAKAMCALPHVWFSNSYGPAEVNQCTFRHIAPGADPLELGRSVPIGNAWSGATCLLIDPETGAESADSGELVVNTPTMMTGYWNRPDLDDNAFFLHTNNRRFYRTGDIARRGPRGELVLIGRRDRQIKVRGYRVELDEIELKLAEHPDVREAAVFPITVNGSVARIGAAVTAVSTDALAKDDLVRFLASRLPSYSVPARTDLNVVLSLPRTTSGKIDRRVLALTASAAEEADQ